MFECSWFGGENVTVNQTSPNPSSVHNDDHEHDFCIDFVVAGFNIIIMTYLIVCHVTYIVRYKRERCLDRIQIMCFLATIFPFTLCLKDHFVLHYEPPLSEEACTFLIQVWGGIAYIVTFGCSYTIFWIRQSKLYFDPQLNINNPKFKVLKVMNVSVLIGIYFTVVSGTILFFTEEIWVGKELPSPGRGEISKSCCMSWEKEDVQTKIKPLMATLFSMTVLFQFSLFFFISYPLLSSDLTPNSGGCKRGALSSHSFVAPDIRQMLKRLALCALMCCFTSFFLHLILVLNADLPRDVWNHIYWPSLMTSESCIYSVITVLTFSNWRTRLFPFIHRRDEHVLSTSRSASCSTYFGTSFKRAEYVLTSTV